MPTTDLTTLTIAQLVMEASTGQEFGDSLEGLPLETLDYDTLRSFFRGGDEIHQALASVDKTRADDFRQMRMGLAMLVRGGLELAQAEVMKRRLADVFKPMNGEWKQIQRRFRMSGTVAPLSVRPAANPAEPGLTLEQRKVRNIILRLVAVAPDLVDLYGPCLKNATTPETFADNLSAILIDLDRITNRLFQGDYHDAKRLVEMERWFGKEVLIATLATIAASLPDQYDRICQTVAENSMAENPGELIRGIAHRIRQARERLGRVVS